MKILLRSVFNLISKIIITNLSKTNTNNYKISSKLNNNIFMLKKERIILLMKKQNNKMVMNR